MGTLFRYVADAATRPLDWANACNICERSGEPIYKYHGFWRGGHSEQVEVEELCRECITTRDLTWFLEEELGRSLGAPHDRVPSSATDIQWQPGQEYTMRGGYRVSRYILVARWEGAPAALLDKLRHTPQSPQFFHWPDWVVCCGDLCEFVGSPASFADLVQATETATYWDHAATGGGRDFRRGGPPEGLEEISLFRCLSCAARYWIDQYT